MCQNDCLIYNASVGETFSSSAACSDNPSKKVLSLLSLVLLVHTLGYADFAHISIFPVIFAE